MQSSPMNLSKSMTLSSYIPVNEAYGDDADSSLTQASTVNSARYENGRRYGDYRGEHLFPNDLINAEHEKFAHHLFGQTLDDKLFLSPLESPTRVLDIGAGNGLWALDMADRYTDAHIKGIDRDKVNLGCATPGNLEFEIEDANHEWLDGGYDLVHIRSMFGTDIEWSKLYKEAFENMVPGAYIEQMEVEIIPRSDDDSCPPNSIFRELGGITQKMREATGREFNITDSMSSLIPEAGFVDTQEVRYKLPVGPWSSDQAYQEIGVWMEKYFRTGVQGWLMAPLTRYFGQTSAEVNDLVARSLDALDRKKEHVYYTLVVVYARKP